jgi:RNA dependent RNA polymerase
MISLDSRLVGDCVFLRPSMIKFTGSDSMDIELCGSSLRPLPMYLNRQLIKILEDMGVQESWFLNLQSREIERLREITATAANAAKFLKSQLIGETGHFSWLIAKLFSIGLEFRSDRFLRDVLELSIMMQVRVMKYRARIPVPLGMTLYGIMDETGVLAEGQVFCTFTESKKKNVLVGKNLVITRSPALHPGDVQLVEAINVPKDSPLLSLSNCICFSQKGDRDLPSKLSGGDLDGDLYNIVWDSACKPTHSWLPADYPRQVPQDIGREVERDDMTDFFIKFMETDQLGRIATAHQVLADQKPLGTLDPDCKRLAELHSIAVDFSKTGIPVSSKSAYVS